MNKKNLKTASKIALLLVIIGFFCPVSCDLNGFEIAAKMRVGDVGSDCFIAMLAMYALFIAAAVSIVMTATLLILKKNTSTTALDWVLLLISIAGGLTAYFSCFDNVDLQYGAYLITAGWIASFILLLWSCLKKE